MKTLVGIRTILFTAVLLVPAAAVFSQPSAERGTVTVIGQGTVQAKPDIATIQVGVETFNREVAAATAENRERMQRVLDTLKSLGIEDRDLQTANYNVFFERRYPEPSEPSQDIVEGTYHVMNTLIVTVRDLPSLGSYIDRAIGAGANQLFGVQFGVAEPATFNAEARVKAIDDAREKAGQIAQAAGVKLGRLLRINESAPVQGVPLPYGALRDMSATQVSPGELTFTVSLELVWEAN